MTEKTASQKEKSKKKHVSRELANKPVDITAKTSWLILIGVLILFLGLLYWALFGTIDVTTSAPGLLVSGGGFAYCYSTTEGFLYDISYDLGDQINEGDVAARVNKPDIVREINIIQNELEEIETPEKKKKNEETLTSLKERLKKESRILNVESGKITDIYVQKGQYINKGDPVLKISRNGKTVKDLIGVLYYPVEEGKTIEANMDCRLIPSITNKETYGFLKGKVVSVSEFPISIKAIADFTGSQKFAELFSKEPVLEVIIDLLPSTETPSGYQWSSSEGPDMKLEPGTLCDGLCITKKLNPIELIFPNLKGDRYF